MHWVECFEHARRGWWQVCCAHVLTCVLQVMPHLMQALEASQGLEDFIYGSASSLPLTQVWIDRGTVGRSVTHAETGTEGME
jgi:hypothetical protein